MRIPKHIGVIPDGNRRWAVMQGMDKQDGYMQGVVAGLPLFHQFKEAGVKEITYYGFTVDNTKRPTAQRKAFTDALVHAVNEYSSLDAELLIIGNTESVNFPQELLPFTKRVKFGNGGIKINLLANYDWEWDLSGIKTSEIKGKDIHSQIKSAEISMIDLIIRWGGRSRLSGFLPVQSIYADLYVVDDLWPDLKPEHFHDAISWYNEQDITLGG